MDVLWGQDQLKIIAGMDGGRVGERRDVWGMWGGKIKNVESFRDERENQELE